MPTKTNSGFILKSSLFNIGIKLIQRLLGIVSIFILARLLIPEDFALIALVSIIIYFFDILSNAGSEPYILQKSNVNLHDLNTAWTLDIIAKAALAGLLIISSEYIAAYFDNEELALALTISSSVLVINALKNPGIILLKKHFNYQPIFWLSTIQKLITFPIVLFLAFYLKNYWALIVGDIISSLIFTVGSYYIHDFKPKFSNIHLTKQWHFSKWIFLKSIIGYLRAQIDTLIVSKIFSERVLGQYYMTRNIVMIPSHSLISPAVEPLISAYSQYKNNYKQLTKEIVKTLTVISYICIPISIFLFFFSSNVVQALLGEQWAESAGLLAALVLLFFYFCYVQVFEQVLIALEKTKALLIYDLFSLIVITASLTIPLLVESLEVSVNTFAFIRGVAGVITMLMLYFYISSLLKNKLIRITEIAKIVWFTFICLIAAKIALNTPEITHWSLIELLIQGSVFIIFIVLGCILNWRIFREDFQTYIVK